MNAAHPGQPHDPCRMYLAETGLAVSSHDQKQYSVPLEEKQATLYLMYLFRAIVSGGQSTFRARVRRIRLSVCM